MASQEAAFAEGVAARAKGRKRAENPYALASQQHGEWDAGWTATLDLDEEADPNSTRDQPADDLGQPADDGSADGGIR